MNKTIITVAPTGAWPKKEQSPHVPMIPKEIADDVYKCYKAGNEIAKPDDVREMVNLNLK